MPWLIFGSELIGVLQAAVTLSLITMTWLTKQAPFAVVRYSSETPADQPALAGYQLTPRCSALK